MNTKKMNSSPIMIECRWRATNYVTGNNHELIEIGEKNAHSFRTTERKTQIECEVHAELDSDRME